MSSQLQNKPEIYDLNQLLKLASDNIVPVEFSLPAKIAAKLQSIRDHAATWVQELTFPTRNDEEWQFTDLSPLRELNFQAASAIQVEQSDIASLILPEAKDSRIVFVNGIFAPELSSTAALPEGVFVGSLGQMPETLCDRLDTYLAQQQGKEEVFTALNTAVLTDVAIVWVAKNKIIETPIHLLFISVECGVPTVNQPRCLIISETGSMATVIEHYAAATGMGCLDALTQKPYFTNGVTEIWVEENATLKHSRIQRDAGAAFHIGKTAVSQGKNSRYSCNAISLGAKLSRHNFDLYQTGEGTETTLNGLTLIGGDQLADTHSAMMLNHPHGTFDQFHKCIVDNQAQAVFNGKVFVPQAAQLTNASQLNRNLLLSPKAKVNTKPQLEITADNVKCSHGATVSQLEEDEIFYLRSRGLSEQSSRYLLIDAFATEILQKLPVESLRQELSRCVACRTEAF